MALPAADRNGTSHDTEALYREHGAAVAALCRSLLRDRGETEDATQQVFLSAHRALLNGAAPREPRAWLLAVARHECYARFRQRAVTPVPTGDAPEGAAGDASAHVLRAGELANVWDEVGRMPPMQREAFLLREIRGLSYGQLADELSLSRPSVRSLLLRARTRLRQRLGDVAAGLGGAQWVQALLRLTAGGDGASPVPAATKAAAVGIGALALAGGGGLVARHAAKAPRHAAEHHRAAGHVHRVAAAGPGVAVARSEVRPEFVDRSSEHSRGHDDSSGRAEERNRGPGSRSSGESSSGSRHDGSHDAGAGAEHSTDGRGGGGSSSSGPGPGSSGNGSSSGSGRDGSGGGGGTPGSSSGSDVSSGSVTTAVASDSDSGGPGSSGSGSSGGSDGSHGSDGGGGSGDGGHDG